MRLHVTGATGYLGRELVRLRPDATTERVDVLDADAVAGLFARLRPDVVVHTAYRQEEPLVNALGSEHVALAAAAVGARLVHLSTDVVFDGRKGSPYVEDDPLSPVTEYGRSKAEAEARVALAHPEALLVRTSLIYGGAQPSKHEVAARTPGNTFYTDEIRNPIRVHDLARALVDLADIDLSGPLHVAGADAVSRHEFAELIAKRLLPGAPAPPGRPRDCSLASGRAEALLQTRFPGVRDVLG
jgi:dTDP-4-dehydrorhamnose reductase